MITLTLTVSIGGTERNGANLGAREWHAFRLATLHAVRDTGALVVFHATGIGIYKGTTEPSYTVIATIDAAAAADYAANGDAAIHRLRRTLAQLAHDYRQDSIALTLTPAAATEFVTA